ncbi:MAG: hypothetical protein WKG03_05200, partial [Telluria sp.]
RTDVFKSITIEQNRFGFDMQPASASYRTETLDVLVTNARSHSLQQVAAGATYDGYFSATLPLSANFNVGVLLGKHYSWVQIDSVQLIVDGDLQSGTAMAPGVALLFDQMVAAESALFQVQAGGMLYLPAQPHYQRKSMCRIVFRPIARVTGHAPSALRS